MRTAKTLIRLGGAQADLSLRWAHTHFVGFVTRQLIYSSTRILENDENSVLSCSVYYRVLNNFFLLGSLTRRCLAGGVWEEVTDNCEWDLSDLSKSVSKNRDRKVLL